MSVVTHLLIHRADIYRDTNVSQGSGRFKREPALYLSQLHCRISPLSAGERTVAMQEQSLAMFGIYAEYGTDLALGDLVVKDGVTYRITGTLPPSKNYFVKWMLEEVQRGKTL